MGITERSQQELTLLLTRVADVCFYEAMFDISVQIK